MARKSPDESRLYVVAESQQGLFTTKQAKVCGYAENTHPYHVKVGHWQRECRGIYRLVHFPVSDEEHFVLWSLWSMNRKEEPQGVFSHLTALAIHELSDAMPARLDLIVPRSFRRFHRPPEILTLHKMELGEHDIQQRQGFRVTTPVRTLLDMANETWFPDDLLRQAVNDALQKGMASRKLLLERDGGIPERLKRMVEKVSR